MSAFYPNPGRAHRKGENIGLDLAGNSGKIAQVANPQTVNPKKSAKLSRGKSIVEMTGKVPSL
jgi:hypothetical protein